MNYVFDSRVAMEFGVDGAVMLQNLYFWTKKNEANNKHYHDGKYWTYNSAKAFSELFPFWTEKQINRILTSLEANGAIVTGNYNKVAYDRTKWYALTDLALSIIQNGEIHFTKQGNGNDQTVKPIPDINTDNKPDSKPDNPPVVINNDIPQGDGAKANDPDKPAFETFWSAYPRHTNKATARKAWEKLRLTSQEYASLLRAIEVQKQSPQWQRDDGQYIPHPSTWLNQRRWEDELPAAQQTTTCTGDSIPVFDEEDMSRYGGKPVPRDWRKPWTGDE